MIKSIGSVFRPSHTVYHITQYTVVLRAHDHQGDPALANTRALQ